MYSRQHLNIWTYCAPCVVRCFIHTLLTYCTGCIFFNILIVICWYALIHVVFTHMYTCCIFILTSAKNCRMKKLDAVWISSLCSLLHLKSSLWKCQITHANLWYGSIIRPPSIVKVSFTLFNVGCLRVHWNTRLELLSTTLLKPEDQSH